MPVYEYVCSRCRAPFEELVFGDESVACPQCKSARVERRWSTFAAPAVTPSANDAPAGCGTCGDPRGPGACGTN